MKKKAFTVFLIIMLLISAAGCWNRRELNEIAILTSVGVDPGPNEKENNYIYQIVNPSALATKGGNPNKTQFLTIQTADKTLFSAARKSTRELSRRLYFGHVQIFVINSKVAKEKGIKDLLDLLNRDHELRENILILIAENISARELLAVQTTLENNSGIALQKQLENTAKNESFTRMVELRDVINMLTSETNSTVIPAVRLTPPIPLIEMEETQRTIKKSVIKVAGFAVFKKDKLIGYLDDMEARALNWITDDIDKTAIVIPYQGGEHTIEVLSSKTEVKAEFKQGKPEILLDIEIDADLGEVNGPIDVMKLSTIKEIETATNNTVKKQIEKLIKDVKEKYKVDIFKFGEAFSRQQPKEWKKIKANWEKEFIDLTVKIKVKTKILEIGMKNKPFQIEMKENEK